MAVKRAQLGNGASSGRTGRAVVGRGGRGLFDAGTAWVELPRCVAPGVAQVDEENFLKMQQDYLRVMAEFNDSEKQRKQCEPLPPRRSSPPPSNPIT